MKVRDIAAAIEEFVPLAWQEDYDNAGLTAGEWNADVEKILIALDVTEAVIDEAVEVGAQMIVSHHPAIFTAQRKMVGENHAQRVVAKALRNGIALYACHTNLDSTPVEGISHRLARMFDVCETALLSPSAADSQVGIGVVGRLAEPIETVEFLRRVRDKLGMDVLRHSRIDRPTVERVAICSGSGGSLIDAARTAKADVYLAGDFRHHDYLEVEGDMILADIGHYESEICAIDILFELLSKKIPTFALQKSTRSINPINSLIQITL